MSIPNSPDLRGIAQPHPMEGAIRADNARRVQQRAAYASLAQSIAQTDFDALRRDPQRQIGGTFEALQKVPRRRQDRGQGITQADINEFLAAFSFDSMADITPRQDQVVQGGVVNEGSVGNRIVSQTIQRFTPTGGLYT